MRSFTASVTAALLLASSADAFVPQGKVMQQRPSSTQQLNALEDLTSILVGGSVDTSALSSMDPTILMGGGAVLALVAIGAAVSGSKDGSESTSSSKPAAKKEPEPEPIDVSIPYDAAALLAYQQQVNPKGNYLDKEFQSFKQMYYDMSVAEVVLKKKERHLKEMQAELQEKYPTMKA